MDPISHKLDASKDASNSSRTNRSDPLERRPPSHYKLLSLSLLRLKAGSLIVIPVIVTMGGPRFSQLLSPSCGSDYSMMIRKIGLG